MARRLAAALLVTLLGTTARAESPVANDADLDRRFTETVHPFLTSYCVKCHSGEKPKAQFDLAPFSNLAAVVQDHPHWALLREKLAAMEMPPEDVESQPSAEARQAVIDWIDAVRRNESLKNAGDPGEVLARRLSNAEYNYTIRDLTGVDIRPTREFPVDPANPAGFDNSGESLSMSPALMNKYLEAAREVANHLVLKPKSFTFAPHPMLVETDRDKYCVGQIVDFYHRQNTDYADYFQAALQFKYKSALGKSDATLADVAAQSKVSPKYLATVWELLEETKEDIGPTAKLQAMWRQLPKPDAAQPDIARAGCEKMRDWVIQFRKKVEPRFPNLAAGRVGANSQPMLMWKNRQYASHRMTFDRKALQVQGEKAAPAETERAEAAPEPGADNEFGPGRTQAIKNKPGDPDLVVPTGQRARYEEAFAKFCAVFPDAFYIEERGRNYFDKTKDRGRLLSAGFHNLMGYFRDDRPLYELLLDEKQQGELDELWQELDFVASANIRTYVQFYLNETGMARNAGKGEKTDAAEDQAITSEARIKQVADDYLSRAKGGGETAVKAVEENFKWVSDGIRWVEKARIDAEPSHLESLLDFARRAYRRPLTKEERDDFLAFYHSLRDKDGLDHESAMRDCIVNVLMSPDFCYRIDLVESSPGIHPLSDSDLASRLSYFLWSSMPDDELLAVAKAGELHRPEVISAQAKRMLKDPKIRALAVEFGGNWLDFRRFEELNTVDRERFSSFNNELRSAMFEEPIRFMLDVFQKNRSVVDFLNANHTFVNPVLAKHYGMPEPSGGPSDWVRVDNANEYGRGGILPMAAFLTKNAPGLRTSPVKRGYWVVKNVLGEKIPPPPAMVPELPRDEAKLDLPLREVLANHRRDTSCASCHTRFDSLGLVFEGYGPVGERREKDLAGHDVDARATFPGGGKGSGLDGLRQYIRERRQKDFIENLCRRMLAYSLNRSVMLSDDLTIEEMHKKLAASDYRFETLIESVVTSPQFLTKRGPEKVAQADSQDPKQN